MSDPLVPPLAEQLWDRAVDFDRSGDESTAKLLRAAADELTACHAAIAAHWRSEDDWCDEYEALISRALRRNSP